MKKNDILLIVGVAVIAIGAIVFMMLNRKEGAKVIITVSGEVYKEANLSENQVIEIITGDGEDKNILTIKDGIAKMTDADCPDRLCVYQKEISNEGEIIVCLPHQIIVTINGAEGSTVDSVAN